MRAAISEVPGGPVVVVDDIEVESPRAGEVLEPGLYVVHAGVDGVTGTATIRLRRRRGATS